MQPDVRKYMEKLEPIAVPTTAMPPLEKASFRRSLAQVRWQVDHVLLQFASSVSKTAQKPRDEWSATDVRELNKIGIERKDVKSRRAAEAGVPGRCCGQGGFLTMIATRDVQKGASICTMIEFNSTVLLRSARPELGSH